jgi:hypothetical protein
VSPVDLAIGLLTLSNRVQQTGRTDVTSAEYRLAGGAEGLLLAYVQDRLQEVPESIRAGLLRGLIFTLVDPITNQRKAEGAGAEEPRYRLPHERLIPVLRRLTGAVLAQLDQTRLLFQDRFAHWKQTGSSQYLLRGEDLRRTEQFRDALLPGAGSGTANRLLSRQPPPAEFFARRCRGSDGSGGVRGNSKNNRLQEARIESGGLPSCCYKRSTRLRTEDIATLCNRYRQSTGVARARETSLQRGL